MGSLINPERERAKAMALKLANAYLDGCQAAGLDPADVVAGFLGVFQSKIDKHDPMNAAMFCNALSLMKLTNLQLAYAFNEMIRARLEP